MLIKAFNTMMTRNNVIKTQFKFLIQNPDIQLHMILQLNSINTIFYIKFFSITNFNRDLLEIDFICYQIFFSC